MRFGRAGACCFKCGHNLRAGETFKKSQRDVYVEVYRSIVGCLAKRPCYRLEGAEHLTAILRSPYVNHTRAWGGLRVGRQHLIKPWTGRARVARTAGNCDEQQGPGHGLHLVQRSRSIGLALPTSGSLQKLVNIPIQL